MSGKFTPCQEPVRILLNLKQVITDGSLPVDKDQRPDLIKLLDNVVKLIHKERETRLTTPPSVSVTKLEDALEMLTRHPRMKAATRNDVTTAISSVITDLRAAPAQEDTSVVVRGLETKVTELTALVEQQATYIHNNIKPVEKPAEVPFLAKEQPDRAFGIYTVNNEWAAYKVKNDLTITEDQLKRMVESEAKLLGHQQLGHGNFQVVVVVSGGNSLRFSLRQALGFNGLQQLFGLAPRQPNNGNELDFGVMLGSMNHAPIRY